MVSRGPILASAATSAAAAHPRLRSAPILALVEKSTARNRSTEAVNEPAAAPSVFHP